MSVMLAPMYYPKYVRVLITFCYAFVTFYYATFRICYCIIFYKIQKQTCPWYLDTASVYYLKFAGTKRTQNSKLTPIFCFAIFRICYYIFLPYLSPKTQNYNNHNIYLLFFIKYTDTLLVSVVLKILFKSIVCSKINVKIANGINMLNTIMKYKILNYYKFID